jgi:hypothetical protein
LYGGIAWISFPRQVLLTATGGAFSGVCACASIENARAKRRARLDSTTRPAHLSVTSEPHVRLSIDADRNAGYIESGQNVVITEGAPLHVAGKTNFIKMGRVP